jgi:electron transport complex protein RnfB
MLIAIASFAVLGLVLGGGLSLANRYLKVDSDPLADELEAMLPGLQCGQCGFPGCRGAAEALSAGKAKVTLCPPGGKVVAEQLAIKLHVDLDLSEMDNQRPLTAFIHEDMCIGCTKCISVCATGCIVGASKQMHTVVSWACLGDRHCIEVCPTDCIEMRPMPTAPVTVQTWHWPKPGSPFAPAQAEAPQPPELREVA